MIRSPLRYAEIVRRRRALRTTSTAGGFGSPSAPALGWSPDGALPGTSEQ